MMWRRLYMLPVMRPRYCICCKVHHSDADSVACHTAHEQVVVVGGEGCAAQAVAAVVVAVNLLGHAEVEFQFLVDDGQRGVVPVEGVLALDVDDADCVVAPLGDGHQFAIRRGGNHFRQRPRVHESDDGVGLCVDDGHC